MKIETILLLLFFSFVGIAQHTFSIVAVDSETGEIGSAGATCLSSEDGALYISDIILNKGAIHTQAWWTTVNQDAAGVRMNAGDSPSEIIDWLVANDNPSQGGNINDRQYGVVDLNNGNPRSMAFTGQNNWDEKGHRVGPGYSIQGNVLISQDVLNDMEAAYLNTTGSLCEKLMATMQAAKRPGADERCLNQNISSSSAFIRVAKPTDTNSDYGNLWLDINVWLDSGTFTDDPIDELQKKFDAFKQLLSTNEQHNHTYKIYPNPTTGIINVVLKEQQATVYVLNALGKKVLDKRINEIETQLDLSHLNNGFYFLEVYNAKGQKRNTIKLSISK